MSGTLRQIPMAILGLPSTLELICSCALTHALAETVRIEWKTYNDSTVLNTIYALMPWKEKPGYAELSMSNRKQVQGRYVQLAQQFSANWLATLPRGPQPMTDYLNKLSSLRAKDRDNIQSALRDVRQVNREVVNQLNQTMRVLEGIKLASTIAVAGIGLGAALAGGAALGGVAMGANTWVFGATNTMYSIGCGLAKTWDQVPSAKVVVISKEVGKNIGGQVGEGVGKGLITRAAEQIGFQQGLISEASRRIDMYARYVENNIAQRLAGHARAKTYALKAQRETAQQGLEEATKSGAKKAAAGSFLKTATPIVFAAWDVIDGICDFRETWNDTR